MTAPSGGPTVRYVTWGELGGGGVYRSQVTDLVALLSAGCDIRLLALVSPRTRRSHESPEGARLLRGPVSGRFPLTTTLLRSPDLGRALPRDARGVLHCRGPLATRVALRVRNRRPGWRVLHDYRGLDAAEIEEEEGSSFWTRRLARLERSACREADAVAVVSEPLRDLVVEDYGVPGERVVVLPTGADVSAFAWHDEDRMAARRALGVGATGLLVYVGSGAAWQLPQVVVGTAAKLAASDAALLVLSNAADHFGALARDAGLRDDRFICRNATPSEIRRLLCAADVALLPRTPSPVNAVAAPVKFAEYLAAGVPVVTVRGAGVFAQKVEDLGLGAVAEAPEPQELARAVARLLHMEDADRRGRCRAEAEREYDLKRIASRYLELYARLTPAG